MSALVSLVGAGPGDPELLTLKAARRLAEADLVLYDALVDARLLELAPRARRFFVGKRAGRRSISQHTLNRLMVRAARRGERVVRLKCGDPFVFGRGGEEALFLAGAGVPFEVVPGVSSAVAAPALSGIPVTHRSVASGFLVVSGHQEATFGPLLEQVRPGSLTLVVLMGVSHRGALARWLVQRGWEGRTPAALCLAASTPRARTEFTTLGALALLSEEAPSPEESFERPPGVLVVGEVVSVAAQLGLWGELAAVGAK